MPSWIPWVGWAIGAIAIIIALYAYFRPPKRLKLSYQTASVRYFEGRDVPLPSEAVMTFGGDNVERLAKTTVILWNAGSEVLRGEDIVKGDPIRVRFEEGARVLSHSVAGTTKKTNLVFVQPSADAPNELVVRYDYLDPRDGLVLHALHDGEKEHPRIVGSAKGVSAGARNRGTIELGEERSKRVKLWADRVQSLGYLVLLVVFVRALARILLGLDPRETDSGGDELTFILWAFAVVTVLFAPPLIRLWRKRRRYPRSLASYLQPNPPAISNE